jgi:hypothetical protein
MGRTLDIDAADLDPRTKGNEMVTRWLLSGSRLATSASRNLDSKPSIFLLFLKSRMSSSSPVGSHGCSPSPFLLNSRAFGDRRDLGSMYDESLPTSGYGYACSATPSSDSPATPGAAGLGPTPGLSFGLIHPRTGPFTGGHPDRVRAARGRWRMPVNAMQQSWKACWGQPLRSSNLLSSATLTCKNIGE